MIAFAGLPSLGPRVRLLKLSARHAGRRRSAGVLGLAKRGQADWASWVLAAFGTAACDCMAALAPALRFGRDIGDMAQTRADPAPARCDVRDGITSPNYVQYCSVRDYFAGWFLRKALRTFLQQMHASGRQAVVACCKGRLEND